MIRLSHVLHPILSAKTLHDRLSRFVYKCYGNRQFLSIARSERDRCWCGGELLAFNWHPSYGVCAECGCYVNQRPPLTGELNRLYSFDLYWRTRQQVKGHPTIEQRSVNDRSDGRVEYWLGLIERYTRPAGLVVEVGCAHGVLLVELMTRGYECIGVEPDRRTTDWVRENMGVDVRPGFFPYVELPKCDLFLAFDVIEHSPVPEAFMKGAAQLLNSGGVVIIQTPIHSPDHQPPFRYMLDKVFDDLEHMYIFSTESIRRLGETAALEVIAEDSWRLAHEIVVFRKE